MKKQRKDNPALVALAAKLGSTNLQIVKHPQAPAEAGESSYTEGLEDNSALNIHNPTDSTPLEPSCPIVTSGFKRYMGQVIEVPIELLRVEDNVRAQVIEDDNFNSLVGTIEDVGLLQNLLVQLTILPNGTEDLLIISGQRRWVASGKAKKLTVPCKIVEGLDRRTRIFYGLIENLMREELTTIEIAFAYRELVNLGATEEELAQTFECHKKTIQRYLSLTTWPEAAIDILRQNPRLFSTDFLFNGISGDILTDPDLLILRLRKKIDQAMGSAGDQPHSQNTKSKKMSDDEITRWNQTACQNLGVPVKMSGTRDNLRITIRCAGDETVKRILERLGIAAD